MSANALNILISLYLILNTIRVFSYVPQIVAVAKDKSPALAISLITWGFWTSANMITGLYATFIVNDFKLALMNYGNTLGCGIVICIVIYKRYKYAQKPVLVQTVTEVSVIKNVENA